MTSAFDPYRHVPLILRTGLVLGFFVAVEFLIHVGWLNQYIVPFPSDIVLALFRVVTQENVIDYFLLTVVSMAGAAAGLVLIGIPFGILVARRRILWQAWGNWVAGMAAAPLVLLYPLFLVVFGRTILTVMMIALVTGLPPVVIKTVEGLTGVRKVLVDVGRSFNLSERQQFLKIVLPAALPAIFLGLRLGLIYVMITVVAVEYLINIGGLGNLVGELAERYDLAATYAVVGFVVAASVLFFVLLERIEKWLGP